MNADGWETSGVAPSGPGRFGGLPRAWALSACVLLGTAGVSSSSAARGIVASPRDALMDQRIEIRVTGLSAGQPIVVRAFMSDHDGRVWQSNAGFIADRSGTVDLERDAPANGDYAGANVMGLIQWMHLPIGQHPHPFTFTTEDSFALRLHLEVDGAVVDSARVVRRFLRPGVTARDVRARGLLGRLYLPPGPGPLPGLVVLGGSEGGLSATDDAALLASHGYAALALAYFGADGLPEELADIPLEYFVTALDWLAGQPAVDAERVGLMGGSKGAEAALLVGSIEPRVRCVVAYLPTSVAWQCLCDDARSSWSRGGAPVPFVPSVNDPTYKPLRSDPIRATINYRYRLRDREAAERAAIAIENVRGPVMLVSGADDQLWPSAEMGRALEARARRFGRPTVTHLEYAGAGHRIRNVYLPVAGSTVTAHGRLVLGGSDEAAARAQADAWPKVLRFLERALARRD